MVKKRHTLPFYLACALTILIALAVLSYLAYTLHLRTEYKAFAEEVNDVILSVPAGDCTVERSGQVWRADAALLDHYDRFLLLGNVNVVSRRGMADNSETITIRAGDSALSFTPADSEGGIALRWDTPQGSRTYTVYAQKTAFSQLSARFSSYARQHEPIS